MTYEEAIVEGLVAAKRSFTPERTAIARVAEVCGLTVQDIMSGKRGAYVTRARWSAMAALRHMGHSKSHVGRCLKRDHSTVVHGLSHLDVIAPRQISPGPHARRKPPLFTSKYHKPQKEAAACSN